MRIGMFIDEYHPKISGMITSTANFKQALENLGHTVYVIAPAEPGHIDTEPNVVRLPSYDPLLYTSRQTLIYPGLARKIAKYNFDIVHSQTEFSMGLLAHEVAKKLKVPHVTSMHTIYAEMVDQYRLLFISGVAILSIVYPLYFKSMPKIKIDLRSSSDTLKKQIWAAGNIFFNHTDGLVVQSEHLAQKLLAHGLKKPCHLIPNGINLARLRQWAQGGLPEALTKADGDIWVVSVARISGEKRPEALVSALAQVADHRVKLIMVGDGPARTSVQMLAAELGILDRVVFTGQLSQEAMAGVMGQSDIFALVSYNFDNQPMSILEAAATGLPIIYCDPQIKEGLSSESAILAASPEPAAIARAIDELVGDAERRQRMSQAARRVAEQFDIRDLAQRLVEVYQQTIAQAAATTRHQS